MWLNIIVLGFCQAYRYLNVEASQEGDVRKSSISTEIPDFPKSNLLIFIPNEIPNVSNESIDFSRLNIDWTGLRNPQLCEEALKKVRKSQPAIIVTVEETTEHDVIISQCLKKSHSFIVFQITPELSLKLTESDLSYLSSEYSKKSKTSETPTFSFIRYSPKESARRRLQSGSIEEFDSYANETSIPDAINLYYQSANSSLFAHMLLKLQSYYSNSFETTEECFLYATAIENLLDPSLSSVQSNSSVELLRVLSLHLYSPLLDYSDFLEIHEKYLNIYLLYLNFYSLIIDSSSEEYFSVVKSVDDSLISFVSNITKGTTYTLYQGFEASSSHYSASGSINLQYQKTLISDLTNCYCSLCSSPMIISLISTNYSKILNDADGFSQRLLDAGVYNASNYSITFYEIQNELQVNCLNVSKDFQVYSNESNFGYSCVPEEFECKILESSTFINLFVDLAQLVSLKRNCATGCDLCKNNPFLCSSCLDSFYLMNQSCLTCHSSCKTCINYDHCLSCKEHAEGPNSSNDCKCVSQFGFDANFECADCQSSSCFNCSENLKICDECFDGFFEFNGSCSACLPECKTCDNSSSCKSCLPYLSLSGAGRCLCQEGFGFNGSLPVCVECFDLNCKTCFFNHSECETCDDGFYLDLSHSCQNCDVRCQTCSDDYSCDSCKSYASLDEDSMCKCDYGLGFNHLGDCTDCDDFNCEVCEDDSSYCQVCIEGYYASSGECFPCHSSCKSCESFENCTSCKQNAMGPDNSKKCICLNHYGFNSENDCTECFENCSLCGSNSSYCQVCKDNYFEDSGQCKSCESSCETCSNSSSCETCKSHSFPFESFCKCQSGYGRDQNKECSTCDSNCLNCAEDQKICTNCQDGYFLNNGSCFKCHKTCITCKAEQECLSCWPNATLNNGSCFCHAGFGKNAENGSCQSCQEKCDVCEKDFSVCESCEKGYGLNGSLCELCSQFCVSCFSNVSQCDLCEGHYYLDGSICKECSGTCENCTNQSTCQSCWQHAYLLDDHSCRCDTGFGLDHSTNKCQPCSESCLNCEENVEICKKCEDNLGINPETFECSSCMMHCLNCSINSSLCQTCEDGFYFNGSSCEKCLINCQTCNDGQSCLTCWNNANLDQEFQCKCDQGLGIDLNTGFCENCADNCSLCFDNHLKCSACKEPFGLHPESLLCQGCLEHCVNCSANSLKCVDCEDGYFLVDDECQPCNNTCKTCSGINECLSCWNNATLTSKLCLCDIGFGTNPSTGFCNYCEEPCQECSLNYLECTKCKEIQSIGLNHISKKCEACSSNCLSCNLNSSQCNSCDGNFYLKDHECHECLNVCQKCSSIENCTECSSHSSLINSMCVCINEFGLNTSGLCDDCKSPICKDCSGDQSICEECKENASLNEGSCTCNDYHGINLKNCESCSDPLCKTCTNDYSNCTICVENTKSGVFPCECVEHATFSSDSKKCLCDEGYLLENSLCKKATRYLQASNINKTEFDSDFMKIHIYLNSEIDTSVSPLCSNIIKITTKLGIGAVCSFTDTTTIRIALGLAWTITSVDALELKADYLIRKSGVFLLSFTDVLVYPAYSVSPFPPNAVISGTSKISLGCSNELVEFNGYGSTGINSETFAYQWSVNIEGHEGSTSSTFQISTSLITESTSSITLYLTVTDIFNNSASSNKTLSIYSNKILTISFDTGTSLTVKPSTSISLQVTITDYCGMQGSSIFTWSSSPSILSSCKQVSPSRLQIPSKTLLSTSSPYSFSVTASISGVTGSTSVTINVINSDLVLLWNRPTGDVSSSLGFTAEAVKSYDPDSSATVLSCSWMTEPESVLNGVTSDGFTISIPGENFQGLKNFSIKVVVSDSGRSTTGSSFYNIVDDLNTVIKMIVPLTRVTVSKQFTIQTSISSTTGSSILWTQLTGPAASIVPSNFPFISFAAGALNAGSSYTFQIAVTESSGKYLRSYASITTNLPPSCLSSLTFSPSSGTSRKTSISLSIIGCRDLDGPDIPLTYSFGYSQNGKDTNLGLASKTNSIKSIFPTGSLTPFVKVCDSLNDCITLKSSSQLTMSSTRRQLKPVDTLEEYEKDCNSFGLTNTLLAYLKSIEVKEQLLTRMIQDFEEFCRNEEKNVELLELALSVISEFMNEIQKESLSKEYISKYFNLLSYLLTDLPEVNDKISIKINEFADQVIKLYPDNDHQSKVFTLLKTLLNIYQNIGEVIELHSKRLIIYKTINFERFFARRNLLFGDINLKFPELNFNRSLIIEIKLILIKLDFPVFQFEIFSNKYFEDYEMIETEKIDLIMNYSAVLKIPNDYNHKVKCEGKSQNQSEIFCTAKTCSSGERICLQLQETGEYFTYQFEGFHQRAAFYFSCSVSLLWIMLSIFFWVFNQKNLEEVDLIKERKTERKSESYDEKDTLDQLENSESLSRIEYHLLLGLFVSNSLVWSKYQRISIYFSALLQMVAWQSVLEMASEDDLILEGLISAVLVWPSTFCLMVLLSRSSFYLRASGVALLVLITIVSLLLTFFSISNEKWHIPLISGFLTDLLILQSISFIAWLKCSLRLIEH